MSDFQSKYDFEGQQLLVSRFRGGFSVAVERDGTFHSIGGFGTQEHGTHAFRDGVSDGQDYETRLEQVTWVSKLPEDQLPADNFDPYWKP